MMRTILLAALLASAAVPPVLAEDMVTLKPEQIGQIFCLSRTGNDEGAITGLLSADLADTIDAAWQKDAAWSAANPGDKPPLGDGIPWQAWPDYAAGCDIGLVTLMKTDAKVEIAYHFPDEPDADFADVLLLKRVDRENYPSVWRIDNVAYSTGNDLRSFLDSAFDNL